MALTLGFAGAAQAQAANTNLYNDAGTKLTIVTKNFAASYNLDKTFALKFGAQNVGTWNQYSTNAAGQIQFVLALGKNEIVDRSNNLIVWTGSYLGATGACTLTRISADANNGTTGVCASAPTGTPTPWVKCGEEGATCQMGGAPLEVR